MARRLELLQAGTLVVLLGCVPVLKSAVPAVTVGAAWLAFLFFVERPRRGLWSVGVANFITLTRVALVVGGALGSRSQALAAFLMVWVLDALDGAVARRLGEASEFGARFDLETDALFVAALSATLVARFDFGPWLLLAGLLRSVLVLARAVFPGEAPRERKSRFGRAVYSVSVVSMLVGFLDLPGAWGPGLAAGGLGLLCVSFAQDFLLLRRRGDAPDAA
jgi:phosphatidylglycerophosphate synthase